MQPKQTPPTKPVMDVTAPMRTAEQPLQVHQAPDDSTAAESANNAPKAEPKAGPATDMPAPKPVVAKQKPAPREKSNFPVGTVVFTLFMMACLSVLAVVVYLKSNS